MKLTKQQREVIIGGVTASYSVMASPSERWGMYKAPNNKVTVVHLPTGQTARRDLSARAARNLIDALEDVPTPHIDALPFGEHGHAPDEREELITLLRLIQKMAREGAFN